MVLESGNSSLTTTYIRRVECTVVTRTKIGAEKEMQRVFKERKGDLDACARTHTDIVCDVVASACYLLQVSHLVAPRTEIQSASLWYGNANHCTCARASVAQNLQPWEHGTKCCGAGSSEP